VVSSAVTRCITNPLEQIVTSIGNCFNLFFNQIPVLWQPIIVILAVLLIVIIALVTGGYQISIPFFFSIGPSQNTDKNKESNQKAIQPAKKTSALAKIGLK
jgi:hypothetical protein